MVGLEQIPATRYPYGYDTWNKSLPQYLEGSPHVTYGYTTLRVSDSVHKCLGPLEVENKEDDRPLIVADGKSPLVVGAENVMHYPSHLTILPAIKFQTPSQDLILAWR